MRNSFSSFGALLCGAFVAITLTSAVADTLDTWRWRNRPSLGNYYAQRIDFLNHQFVVPLSAGGGMLTSEDGISWTENRDFDARTVGQMTYGNGRYVAVGNGVSGTFTISSTDLVNWATNDLGTSRVLSAIAFGEGIFAAVGSIGSVPSNNYAGYLITSVDGMNWTLRSSLANSPISDIVYGAGKFVAALGTGAGQALVSDNGTNWNLVTISNGRSFAPLSFANGKFYASGLHYISNTSVPDLFSSSDGLVWSPASDPRTTGLAVFRAVFGNGLLLGINGESINPLSSSVDGNNFTNFSASNYLYSSYIAFGNGVFVNSKLQRSLDGTNWSPETVFPPTANFIQEMLENADGYVAIGIASPLLVSSNGLEFPLTTNTMPAFPSRVRFADGLYHGAAGSGAIVRSTNGLDWELRNSATTQNLNDIEFGDSLWVAVGNNGTITASTTGNAWSLRTSGTAVALNGITFATNLFVVVGQSGTVLTSSDGNSWSPQYSGTLETLNKITFGDGQFVAVGQHGTIVTSPDAINWTASTSGTTSNLLGIAFGDGAFCVDGSGIVLTSVDGVTWQQRQVQAASQLSGVRFFNGTFFVFGGANILQSGPVIAPQLQAGWNNGFPQISVHATPDLLLRMESSDDLGSAQWTDCGLISLSPAGNLNFQDSNSVQSARFYRVVAP